MLQMLLMKLTNSIMNPASTDIDHSDATTLGAGGTIGIILANMAVVIIVAYAFYCRRKSARAAGQLELAIQEAK